MLQQCYETALHYPCDVPRPKTHDDALRTRLLDRAGELLSTEGPSGLSLRRLATDVDTSTTAVYSLFGGKPGLVREVFVEAFRRFGERCAEVAMTDDPAEDLVQLGLAYRASALADPHLFSIMFTKVVPGFEPDDDARAEATATFRPLLEMVRRAVRDGVFVEEQPEVIALALWGGTHGLVSLELGGCLPPGVDIAAHFERALRGNLNGWRRKP
jgi:AcrR family transcriptional regulator